MGCTRYDVVYAPELLLAWDAEPRPLIDLDGPVAEPTWKMSDDYMDWLDKFSHPVVDPSSERHDRPPRYGYTPVPIDALAVCKIL